jgi:hypothetical protein
MSDVDYSSGLSPAREAMIAEMPSEPFWTENIMFALYDETADVGFWLHLGSIANDWGMWEDRTIVSLPGDEGVLHMAAYHLTPQERKPAGSNLAFKCIEPFRRWKITFDGFAWLHSNSSMAAGVSAQGPRRRLAFELDVECASPVWDAQTSAHSATGKGGMDTQSWAKEHYEQLFRTTGRMTLDGKDTPIRGTGWRDHSRGPRGGGGGDPWGGHMIAGCIFPSGRSFIFSRYYRTDGRINLEGGCVFDSDGVFHHVEVVTAPRLEALQMSGEELPFELKWSGGRLQSTIITKRSVWIPLFKGGIGADLSGRGLIYAVNFGSCEWDGEIGYPYLERSDALNDFPEKILAA